MEQYDVKLYDRKRDFETEGVVFADEGETSDEIILTITVEGIAVTAKSDGYFSAYQSLRDQLLGLGFGLKCSGSLLNATQSAMMAYTPKVYLIEIGKQALMKNIVNIWDYCDIKTFPDTREQAAYAEQWRSSLKAN